MLGAQPSTARRNGSLTAAPEGSPRRDDALPRATESLTRSAAAVRRSSGHPRDISELALVLEHVQEALDDLSAGMARLAMAVDADDSSPGGTAWRLRTLHHALRAARDLCTNARDAATTGEPATETGPQQQLRERGLA